MGNDIASRAKSTDVEHLRNVSLADPSAEIASTNDVAIGSMTNARSRNALLPAAAELVRIFARMVLQAESV